MLRKLCLLVVAITEVSRTIRVYGESGLYCSNTDHATRSSLAVDEEAVAELIQSLMTLTVNRTGLIQVVANKFKEGMEDPLTLIPNSKLDQNTEMKFPFLVGPESLFKVDNMLYAAAENAIYRIDLTSGQPGIVYDGNAKCPPGKPCSRPLGLRIKGDRLLCADNLQGLIEVNLSTGESTVHLAVGTPVGDIPLLFPDDIDVDWDNDIVYMSDASTKWTADNWVLAVIESDASSRIIRFDLKTGRADVFAQNIRFANGVQISHDKKFLLVDEFSTKRILKYHLDDSLPAFAKSFTGLLPGNPDNIRPSSSGGYWVALAIASSSRNLLDELQTRPDLAEKFGNSALTVGRLMENMGKLLSDDAVRALGQEVQSGLILLRTLPRYGVVLELDADGNIIQSLQSTQLGDLTEVLEYENGLYCGSYKNKFILSVPKANLKHS